MLFHLMQDTLAFDKSLLKRLPGDDRWLARLRNGPLPVSDVSVVHPGSHSQASTAPKALPDTGNGLAVELF
jgi:hypothetical protein